MSEPSPPSPPRRGKKRRALLAMSVSVLLALLAGELLARALFGAPLSEREPLMEIRANPHRGWEMVPGLHYTYQHAVQVNTLGLRNAELGAKRPGELRVLMLGDSQLFGQGVAQQDTVPSQLERLLADAVGGKQTVTVVNGGHRAYDTRQELALLEELGPKIEPDVVIVWWYWNDIDERDIDGTYERLTASGPIVFDVGAKMAGWTRAQWYVRQAVRQSALVMTLYDQFRAAKAEPPTEGRIAPAIERAAGYARRLRELSQQWDFKPYYVLLPDVAAVVGDHFSDAIAERVGAVVTDAGIPTIDVKTALVACTERLSRPPIIPYDFHYDREGHGAAAEAVAERLLADEVCVRGAR